MNETENAYYTRQHAVVTGGASGIGAAIAEQLCASGVRVTLMGRNPGRLAATAERLGAKARQVDISDADNVRRGFAAAADNQGPVTILVNNAGAAESAAFAKMQDDMWQRMLAVNLTGTYLCTRAVIGDMLDAGFGRVVNIASTAAQKGFAYASAYCAAKHGVLGLTRSLAIETARKGITVNAVCPGYCETDMLTRSLDNIVATTGMDAKQALNTLLRDNPQGRLIQPREVAAAVMWLCHPDSAAVTGQAIAVAGGET